jgi:hypothetical protein
MKHEDEFKRYEGLLGKILYLLPWINKPLNIPLFGVKGAGKSYFVFSLNMFLSMRKMGNAEGTAKDYLNKSWGTILQEELLPITQGNWDIDLVVKEVYNTDHTTILSRQADFEAGVTGETDSDSYFDDDEEQSLQETQKISTRFFLRTNDLSGQEFISAMKQLSEPTSELGDDPITKKFIQVVQDGDGCSMVVDLVRRTLTAEQYKKDRDKYIREAFAEQLVPLARGLELALRNQRDPKSRYPVFLVFPKRDIHGLNSREISNLASRMFAMTFASLEAKVSIHIHSVQNMGFQKDKNGDPTFSRGLGLFLASVYEAAVR